MSIRIILGYGDSLFQEPGEEDAGRKGQAKDYGALKSRILLSLSVLIAADSLGDVPNVPPTRRHKLTRKDDIWALDLSANWRMLIKALNGVDPASTTKVEIMGIEDYH